MSLRFPLSEAPEGANEAVKAVEKSLVHIHGRDGRFPFPFMQEDGQSLVGYYGTLSYSPVMAEGLFELGKTLSDSGTVKPRNRELAILGLASVIKAPYIAYCHRDIGSRLGFSDEQWNQGLAGGVPEGLNQEEQLVYRLGRMLPVATEPLDEATWQEVLAKMTKIEFVGVVHVVSAYRSIKIASNIPIITKLMRDHVPQFQGAGRVDPGVKGFHKWTQGLERRIQVFDGIFKMQSTKVLKEIMRC